MDRPHGIRSCPRNSLSLHDLPEVVGAEAAWALATVAAEAGRTTQAANSPQTGYRTSTHAFDTPHIRFNLADTELTALRPGRPPRRRREGRRTGPIGGHRPSGRRAVAGHRDRRPGGTGRRSSRLRGSTFRSDRGTDGRSRHRLGVPVQRGARDDGGDARERHRSGGDPGQPGRPRAPVPVAGPRTQPGPGLGVGGRGRGRRGHRHPHRDRRDDGGRRSVRRRGAVPPDRHPVRRPHAGRPAGRVDRARRRPPGRSGRPIRRRVARPRRARIEHGGRRIRGHRRPGGRHGRLRACRDRLPTAGSTGVGAELLHPRGRTGRRLRCADPGGRAGQRTHPADAAGTRGGGTDRFSPTGSSPNGSTCPPGPVEGHIYRAMGKTGTTSREELANLFRRRRP